MLFLVGCSISSTYYYYSKDIIVPSPRGQVRTDACHALVIVTLHVWDSISLLFFVVQVYCSVLRPCTE